MTSPLHPFDAVRAAELQGELDALVRRLDARAVAKRRPIALEPGAPKVMHALWSAVGWADAFARCELACPELPAARQAVLDRFAEYRSWSSDFQLGPQDLPHARLVYDDGAGVGIYVTDESGALDDPAVVAVTAGDATIEPVVDSYARWCGAALVRQAFAGALHLGLRMDPWPPHWPHAAKPFPLLAPACRELDAGVWLIPGHATQLEPFVVGWTTLAHDDLAALVHLLRGVRADVVEFRPRLPGDRIEVASAPAALQARWPDLHALDRAATHFAGAVAGLPVLARLVDGGTELATEPGSGRALSAAL
jgi:hypothetical protein